MDEKIGKFLANPASRWPRRPLLALSGLTLVFLGAVLLVLPGPGLVLIAAGLSMLGVEHAAARRVQRRLRDWLRRRGW